jgi:acetyl esterase
MLQEMGGRLASKRARTTCLASTIVVVVLVSLSFLPLTAALAGSNANVTGAIRVQSNVVWSTGNTVPLRLDVYQPATTSGGRRAAVVLIHGGGWQGGDKTNLVQQGRALAALGYVAISVEYRLAPQYVYPAAVDDVQAAVKWLRDPVQLRKYKVDPTRIGVLGVSAGGNLASLLGTLGRGSLSKGSRVAVVVSWSGIYKFEGSRDGDSVYLGCAASACQLEAAAASPQMSVDATDAPTLLVHAADDWIVPLSQAQQMAATLSAAGVPNELVVVPGIDHATQLNDQAWAATVTFLARYLGHG